MDLRDYALYAGLYLLSRLVYVLLRKGRPAEERRCVSLCLRVCMCVCVCVCAQLSSSSVPTQAACPISA